MKLVHHETKKCDGLTDTFLEPPSGVLDLYLITIDNDPDQSVNALRYKTVQNKNSNFAKTMIRYLILLQFIHVLSHDTEYLQLPYISYTRGNFAVWCH